VRRTECVGRARFHFDEYQCFFMAIAADQIDLTAPFRPEVLIQQAKSISAEIIGGYSFSSSPERQMRSLKSPASHSRPEFNGKENASEQPARTIADGSGKARGSVDSPGAPAFHSLCFGENRIVETRNANSS
jgi:hypothetical protein